MISGPDAESGQSRLCARPFFVPGGKAFGPLADFERTAYEFTSNHDSTRSDSTRNAGSKPLPRCASSPQMSGPIQKSSGPENPGTARKADLGKLGNSLLSEMTTAVQCFSQPLLFSAFIPDPQFLTPPFISVFLLMSIPFLRTALALTALTFSPAVLYPSFCPGGDCGFLPFQSPSARATDFCSEPAAPLPTVVRILVEAGSIQNYGTGTWIQLNTDRNAVLTCAHLFVSGRSERITVYFPNLPPLPVQIQAINREWDAALLVADAGASSLSALPQAVPLAQIPPNQGDYLRFCGYGPNGSFLWNVGTLRGYCRLPRTAGCCTMVVTGTARMGDSGGPIFTLDGQLAGVLWGTDKRSVYGTWAGKIRQIFDAEFQKVASVPEKPKSRLHPFRKPRKKPRPEAAPPTESAIRSQEPNASEPPKDPIPLSLLLTLYLLAWRFPAALAWRWMKKRREKASA